MPRDASGRIIPGSYDQPQDDGGGEAGIRQAIAERFPDVQPDKLDEIYQAWQEHSHWAQREGERPDLEQFFQQYEADAQGFGGREPVNKELDPAVLARMKKAQQPQQNVGGIGWITDSLEEAQNARPPRQQRFVPGQQEMMQNPELDQNSFEYQEMKRRLQKQQSGLGQAPQPYR